MNARFAMIAALTVTVGSSASAEPPKAPAKPAVQQAKGPVPVMLASADHVAAPAPAEQAAPAPAKKRTARVTTCRCGDQIAQQPEQ